MLQMPLLYRSCRDDKRRFNTVKSRGRVDSGVVSTTTIQSLHAPVRRCGERRRNVIEDIVGSVFAQIKQFMRDDPGSLRNM